MPRPSVSPFYLLGTVKALFVQLAVGYVINRLLYELRTEVLRLCCRMDLDLHGARSHDRSPISKPDMLRAGDHLVMTTKDGLSYQFRNHHYDSPPLSCSRRAASASSSSSVYSDRPRLRPPNIPPKRLRRCFGATSSTGAEKAPAS